MILRKRVAPVAALVSLVVLTVPLTARADLPAGVATAFTELSTDFTSAAALGWTAFGVIIGGVLLFKVVKKVFRAAT